MYKRVLIKLSGEAFSNGYDVYNINILKNIVSNIIFILNNGIEVAIVIGAGNLWRGKNNKKYLNISDVDSDYIGMLGTAMNALVIKRYILKIMILNVTCKVQLI